VTAPALAYCDECGVTSHVYAAASGGRVACLDASSGKANWTFDVAKHTQAQPQLLSSPAVALQKGDYHGLRRLYFGAGIDSLSNSSALLYCFEDESSR
jgi:outer membrane protein assembly factor BamB